MNSEILIVNLVVTGFVFLPYILFIYIGQKQVLEIDQAFNNEIIKNNLKIDVYDRWNENKIGIDHKNKQLLFVQRRNEIISVEIFDLSTVTGTLITPYYNRIKVNREFENQLDKLIIELTNSDKNSVEHLILYDSDYLFSQSYEMRHAEKWNKLIGQVIQTSPRFRKIAS